MANDAVLHTSLRASLVPLFGTESADAWQRLGSLAVGGLWQLRTVYQPVDYRDANAQRDVLVVEVVYAHPFVQGAESSARDAVRLLSQTLSRPSWWRAVDLANIENVVDESMEIGIERVGRAIILRVLVRLRLKP